jgi:hypothetical protein
MKFSSGRPRAGGKRHRQDGSALCFAPDARPNARKWTDGTMPRTEVRDPVFSCSEPP